MKRFLACLALCASLSASAQGDNCTVLGVQELSSLYSALFTSVDSINQSVLSLVDSLNNYIPTSGIQELGAISETAEHNGYGCGGQMTLASYTVPEGETWKISFVTMSSLGSWTVNGVSTIPYNQGAIEYWLNGGDVIGAKFNINGNFMSCVSQNWTVTSSISGVRFSE